jgi:hypothetical protein
MKTIKEISVDLEKIVGEIPSTCHKSGDKCLRCELWDVIHKLWDIEKKETKVQS